MNILQAFAMVATNDNAEVTAAVRADIWLWAARFFKTRSLAKRAIEAGKIAVNELPCKPSKSLHVGDHVVLQLGTERMEVDILKLEERRGPAAVAQTLYRETDAGRIAREAGRERRRMQGLDTAKPSPRPDKRSRRLIHRFLGKNGRLDSDDRGDW
jgi:ribosome-associated heat shock protein Hsp15